MLKNLFGNEERKLIQEEIEVIIQLYVDYKALISESDDYQLRNEVGNSFIKQAKELQDKDPLLVKKILLRQSATGYTFIHPQLGELKDVRRVLDSKITEVSNQIIMDTKTMEFLDEYNQNKKRIKKISLEIKEGKNENYAIEDMPEIKITPIGNKFDRIGKLTHYALIDVKTTGKRTEENHIVEIAIVKVVEDEIKECLYSKIDNQGKEAPSLGQIKDEIINFVGISPVVGYYISFDLKFLFSEGIDLISNHKIYDVMQYIKKLKPKLSSYELDDVMKEYGYALKAKDSLDICLMSDILFKIVLDEVIKGE